jgi:hypothetical protein
MWIERIEIVGFGAAQKEAVEFRNNAVNFFQEVTGGSKFLIPAAVLAAFFGAHPGNGNQTDEHLQITKFRAPSERETPFLVSVEFFLRDRKLRLTRNLNDDKIMILDRSRGDSNVTHEFVKEGGPGQAGEVIIGLDRAGVEALCLLLPRGPNGQVGAHALLDFLKKLTNGTSPILSEAQAVHLIDESIANFPYKSISIKIDFLVDELEKQRAEIKKRLSNYQGRRSAIVGSIARLKEIGPGVGTGEGKRRAQEYFKACLRAAETDGQIMQMRSQQGRLQAMKKELHRLGSLQGFTIESQRQIEELWTRRQSRLADYHSLADDVTPKIVQYEQQDLANKRKWESLHDFTAEQAQAFAQMANNFNTMMQELNEFESQLGLRQKLLGQQPNVDLAKFEQSRRMMQALDPQDINDAKSFSALLTGFRNQAVESDRGKWRAESLIKEIEGDREAKEASNPLLKVFKPNTARPKELEGAQADLERHVTRLNDLKGKISGLEQRLTALAQKAGVADGAVLVQHINDYNAASSQLKELDILQQMIESRRSSIQRLRIDLEPYFKQSGRDPQSITPENATELAEELQSCMNDLARLETGFEKAKISREQLEFLLSEVRNIEEILAQLFANAGLENPGDIEASYNEFYSKVAAYHHWRLLEEEVEKIEKQFELPQGAEDFGDKISRLEIERRQTWERIQHLVDNYPEIAEQRPPELAQLHNQSDTDVLGDERERLQAEVRDFFTQYETEYPALSDKLEGIERELARTRANRLSLELARDKLNSLLREDLASLETISFQAFDRLGDALPIFIDADCLGESEIELSLALKFLTNVVAAKRQVILLSTGDRAAVSRLMQSSTLDRDLVRFCLRTPAAQDGSLQRA